VAASSAAALTLLTAACGSSSSGADGPDPSPAADDPAWSTSTEPVEARGLVWAADGVVHLSDGSTVEVGEPMTTYVVAGDGVYYTPAEDDGSTEHSSTTTGDLRFADREGTVTDTGLTVYVDSIGSSPDGRYLGFVDATSGPEDRFSGQPRATAVVVDLTTGERVVETADGMGDPQEDDLAHDYPEVSLGVRFPDRRSAYVEGLGDFLFSLPDGTGAPDESGIRSPSDPVSPDQQWTIEDRGLDDAVVSGSGEAVQVRTASPRRDLRWWLDDSTVVGIAITGPGTAQELGSDNRATLITCRVPEGTCRQVEGTAGDRLQFPVGAGDEGLDLGAT
jgi:hypothetical protein